MRFFFLLTLLSLNARNYAQDSIGIGNWNTFSKDNFTILYPNNWEVNTANQPYVQFTLMSPFENENDKLSENITLQIQNLNGQAMNYEQYAGLSKSQVVAQLRDGRVLSEEKKSTINDEYYRLMYSGKMSDIHLVYLQHIRIKEGKVYVLTFTCEFSKVTEWEKAGEEVLKTFKIF